MIRPDDDYIFRRTVGHPDSEGRLPELTLCSFFRLNKQSLVDVYISCNDPNFARVLLDECPYITHLRWHAIEHDIGAIEFFEDLIEREPLLSMTLRLKYLTFQMENVVEIPEILVQAISRSPDLETFYFHAVQESPIAIFRALSANCYKLQRIGLYLEPWDKSAGELLLGSRFHIDP